jgi:hypothetical protein
MNRFNFNKDAIVARMKLEIMLDIADARVPNNVASFAALHDYVDANEYGGFCEDECFDAMIEYFGGRDQHEGLPVGMSGLITECQDEIDAWLREGEYIPKPLDSIRFYPAVLHALRTLADYVGGWDEGPAHPCGIAARVLAKVQS